MTLVVFVALYVLVYIECLVRRWLSAAALLTWACLVTLGYVLVFDSWTNAACAWEQVTPGFPGAGCRQPAAPSLGIRPPWGRGLHVVCGARLLPMPWPWVCDSGRPQSAFGGRRFLGAEGGWDWLRGLRIWDSGCGRPPEMRGCGPATAQPGGGVGGRASPEPRPEPRRLRPQLPFFLFVVFVVYTLLPFSTRGAVAAGVVSSASHLLVLGTLTGVFSKPSTRMGLQVRGVRRWPRPPGGGAVWPRAARSVGPSSSRGVGAVCADGRPHGQAFP